MIIARLVLLAALLFAVRAPGQEAPAATPRPVSVQELSLLLRSGYTGPEVLRETTGRPLLAPLDAAAERALLEAGADARTIAALRDGRQVVTATEAAAAQQHQAVADQYRLSAWEADQGRRADAARASMQTKLATRREEALQTVAKNLRDKLVQYKDGRLGPYDNAALASKKLFLLYASASWCGPCRKLTPQLVEFYKKFAPAHPEVEFVLIPNDRSAADTERYMRSEGMPWPALEFERLAQEPELAGLNKEGIPRVVLIDGSGTLLADNVENGKYLEPRRVIDALVARVSSQQAER